MKLPNGILKIMHGFNYAPDASFEKKCAVMRETLTDLKEKGYDGIVTNVDIAVAYADAAANPGTENGYLRSEESWNVLVKRMEICRELGLRVWIYDELGYPSGAAGTLTLDEDPDLEALALAAVHQVLQPDETVEIGIPYGHLAAMGAFGYFFDGDTVTTADLEAPALRPVFENGVYRFENRSERKLFCLGFFTKRAFEGTHCQHNAFAVRRYIDIGHPKSGATFVENTYRPYYERLEEYFKDGTIEAFFADESSYMAVYFNLKKKPRGVVHEADPEILLYAMVNWSRDLVEYVQKTRGYLLTDHLPHLFMGDGQKAQRIRQDYYMALTELAQQNFFQPLADFCGAIGTRSSGHILLEERISDHPLFQGSFFPLLKTPQVPGMDMLDSRPERVWKKAFTPLLVKSISMLHRDGTVMDEVSAHFQNKFSVKVEPWHIFTSLVLQHIFGATLFTSYYHDENDAILHRTPDGRTVLQAVQDVLRMTRQPEKPSVALHYPIEKIMAHSVSPVDVARVFDSILNEFQIPYPIDRADLDKDLRLTPLVTDASRSRAKALETVMESCMFCLMDRQVSFLFADTESLTAFTPEQLVVYADGLTEELRALLPRLREKGCTVYCVGGSPAEAPEGAIWLPDAAALPMVSASAGTAGVAALWNDRQVFLANSENAQKEMTLELSAASVTELFGNEALPFAVQDGRTTFTIPPYGVALVRYA